MREIEAERDTADAQDAMVERKRGMLLQLRGIRAASAAILAREIFGRTFANRQQLGSYLGLTPSAYDIGSCSRTASGAIFAFSAGSILRLLLRRHHVLRLSNGAATSN
ncbi:transposase [Bradyrhizobium sp. CCBAU 53421]|uniref:transposase n=1 Tax=Bradyrhizobium sp. CCBAU 53421 TaxID=1325120 RepID=UPI00188B263A|nr:transposase [Bradyrhizobium sp. CCBAU 53421]QOZ31654.1 hypothetical protein XH92_07930 [Bradyrhizobium sp. CCBAU 53421]